MSVDEVNEINLTNIFYSKTELFKEAITIRDILKLNNDFKENPIDDTLNPIMPFIGSKDIQLIIIGQDPTIKNSYSRKKIITTLNLDTNGALKRYVKVICNHLKITIENVYATNIFKYFYSNPPANTIEILYEHLNPNLDLLKKEISIYKDIPIITFGVPVFRLLVKRNSEISEYWDYNKKTQKSNGNYKSCLSFQNKLQKEIFPLPHQPGIRNLFYKNHMDLFLNFLKTINDKNKLKNI